MFLLWCWLIFYCGAGFLSVFVNLFEFSEGIWQFYRDIIMIDKVKVEDNCFTIPWSNWKQFCIESESRKWILHRFRKKLSSGVDITILLNLRPELASLRPLPQHDGILHVHIWSGGECISFNFMIWYFRCFEYFCFHAGKIKGSNKQDRVEVVSLWLFRRLTS